MGGRGTYAAGKQVAYTFATVNKINGVKSLVPINSKLALKLPEESHKSNAYVLYDKDGVFHQYREYNNNHEVTMEIGYHNENSLGVGDVLHVHIYTKPGVANHNDAMKFAIHPGEHIYEKYKFLFKGVKGVNK